MIIRAEEPSDYPAIRALLTRVFGRLDEARLVEDLRRDGDCVLSGVAESGVNTPDDAARMARLGFQLALIGSALMRAPDPAGLIGRMLGQARTLEP